jgi:hypothetical protein
LQRAPRQVDCQYSAVRTRKQIVHGLLEGQQPPTTAVAVEHTQRLAGERKNLARSAEDRPAVSIETISFRPKFHAHP